VSVLVKGVKHGCLRSPPRFSGPCNKGEKGGERSRGSDLANDRDSCASWKKEGGSVRNVRGVVYLTYEKVLWERQNSIIREGDGPGRLGEGGRESIPAKIYRALLNKGREY